MSLNATFSIENPLQEIIFGRAESQPVLLRGADGTVKPVAPPGRGGSASRSAADQRELEKMGMADRFGFGALPAAEDLNDFLKAWLPRAIEHINNSNSDSLGIDCIECGAITNLQIISGELLQTEALVTNDLTDNDDLGSYLLEPFSVQAPVIPDTCQACGASLSGGDQRNHQPWYFRYRPGLAPSQERVGKPEQLLQ